MHQTKETKICFVFTRVTYNIITHQLWLVDEDDVDCELSQKYFTPSLYAEHTSANEKLS